MLKEWQEGKIDKMASYVWNRTELMEKSEKVDYLFGLFNAQAMEKPSEKSKRDEPSLAEMVEAAITVRLWVEIS